MKQKIENVDGEKCDINTNDQITAVNILTPLQHPSSTSKVLAAILMIILPFVGAYIGYEFANEKFHKAQMNLQSQPNVKNTSSLNTQDNPINDIQGEPMDFFIGKGKFGYFKDDNGDYHYVWLADEGAYDAAENPFVTEIFSNNEVTIYSIPCFRSEASRCATHNLLSMKSISSYSMYEEFQFQPRVLSPYELPTSINPSELKYLSSMSSGIHYIQPFSLHSPDGTKIFFQDDYDGIKLIDLLKDEVKVVFSTNDYNPADQGFVWSHLSTTDEPLDMYLSKNTKWIDDETIQIELFKFDSLTSGSNTVLDRKQITVNINEI